VKYVGVTQFNCDSIEAATAGSHAVTGVRTAIAALDAVKLERHGARADLVGQPAMFRVLYTLHA
jgi:hypothetical protein